MGYSGWLQADLFIYRSVQSGLTISKPNLNVRFGMGLNPLPLKINLPDPTHCHPGYSFSYVGLRVRTQKWHNKNK